ncbi:hypothetical protein [Chengkuizengella axinellae]|uniref:Uncharacterized protein n=1 Tax=Chengkuizengella axinellae TaxID=3064388 RepID=A0ABT9IW82_9BACL|nr:hypothetical protein [Chengkuizengella sp. 2205SS18-9]MDP5273582.1 hypothetical protein [Chengkuizengella sp. 2205SS18-9]
MNVLNQYYTDDYSETIFSWYFIEEMNYYQLRATDNFLISHYIVSVQNDENLNFELHQDIDSYELKVTIPSNSFYSLFLGTDEIIDYTIDKKDYLITTENELKAIFLNNKDTDEIQIPHHLSVITKLEQLRVNSRGDLRGDSLVKATQGCSPIQSCLLC